jgi:hypothetical protein
VIGDAIYTREEFLKQPVDFRIGGIISDGQWYSFPKWKMMSNCTEEELSAWIEEHMLDGSLLQSPTGAKSYRLRLDAMLDWYNDHDLEFPGQLTKFIYPPRVWDGMTEVDGFLKAPLRTIGIVSFNCSNSTAERITEELRGIARVREVEPGRWKAFCLNAQYVRSIVASILDEVDDPGKKIHTMTAAKRREMQDFTDEFNRGMLAFYVSYSKENTLKSLMETIRIFIPNEEDQNSQITEWVILAIQKFDESASVPFSGYLDAVLKRWPFDLPQAHLGKELSTFQRNRSRAIKALKKRFKGREMFTSSELAEEMDISMAKFADLDEKHNVWLRTKRATELNWEGRSDEKEADHHSNIMMGGVGTIPSDTDLAHKLSVAVVSSAIDTGRFDDAYTLISQIDVRDIDMKQVESLSPEFVKALGSKLAI